MLFILLPTLTIVGGVAIWFLFLSPNEVLEATQELAEIAAATAPPIVPAERNSGVDVLPSQKESPVSAPTRTGPSYIAPVRDEVQTISQSLDMPPIDLLATSEYEERRSKLLDALHASPIVEVEPILRETDVTSDRDERHDHVELAPSHKLAPGTVIPSVLLQGINSDLPGVAVAQVSRNVYDSKTGLRLLIPRGSRIFGTYGTEPIVSDQRMYVTWMRIDLPDGNTVDLKNVISADQSGFAGLKDQVHQRTGKALAVTGLNSLISAGLLHAANPRDGDVLTETTARNLARDPSLTADVTREIARQYGDIANQIAQRHLDQLPTLTIRPGYEFVIQIVEELKVAPYSR